MAIRVDALELFPDYPSRFRQKVGSFKEGIKYSLADVVHFRAEMNPRVNRRLVTERWRQGNSTPEGIVNQSPLPLLEIAGPTPSGYFVVDLNASKKPLIVTNIKPEIIYENVKGQKAKIAKADMQLDASKTWPFADGIWGGVFVSAYSPEDPDYFLTEATRVIAPEGVLCYQFTGDQRCQDIVKRVEDKGFVTVAYDRVNYGKAVTWSMLFQKPLIA